MVRDFTGLDFQKIKQLYYDEFLLYVRDAFIYKLEQSEGGREYLRNAYRILQTEPQRKKIRERMEQ